MPESTNHPPATNRGVETHTTQQIDWISLTFPSTAKDIFPDGLPKETSLSKPFNAYDNAAAFEDGRVQLWHSTRPEMGIHVVMSGKTCSTLRNSLVEIIERCWERGGHVARFDLALNDLTSRIHAEDSTGYIRAGEQICRAQQYPVRTDPHVAGYSQYAGKMASEVHVCIYDKSAEQKEAGFHVRVEIRFKGKKADKAAHTYLQLQDCRPIIKGFLDFPTWPEWAEVFAVLPVNVPAEKHYSATVAWLLGQVARSMAKQIDLNGGEMWLIEEFWKSVQAYLSDLRHDN